MVFVVDDFGAWLVGKLADAGRRGLITWVLGTDQERALRQAASTAVQLTATELHPQGDERAQELVRVVNQVFTEPLPGVLLAGQRTLLEVLQAGVAGQLAVLDDVSLTGTESSSSELLGVPAKVLAAKLTSHLVREIILSSARSGALAPLANQINHDVTHMQGQRLESVLGHLADEVRKALAGLDDIRLIAAAPTALAQLPPETAGFAGRDDELSKLTELFRPRETTGPAVVLAVTGLAGIGKTTLAIHAGHAARRRGWFRGGVLFIDLHGYDEAPVEPGQALDSLLRALGVPSKHIPPTVEDRAGLYRSELAQISEPVLVIADNASSEAQVRSLLPGTGPHKVLVTSRHILAGLNARLIDVTILEEEAAIGLLDAALQTGRPGDDRITDGPAAAGRLAHECGGLPLALQITAALLKADPALTTSELAQELAAESDRLERLQYDDGSGPGVASVKAAFELSYHRLEQIPARVFRLLPINPGPYVSTATAAALADLPVIEVRRVLGGLARAHLAETAPGAMVRWRMHDLVRLYAQRLADEYAVPDGQEQARDRLLQHYLHLATAANQHVLALPNVAGPADFGGRDNALDWLDAERPNLVAAAIMAAASGHDHVARELPFRLGVYLDWRRRFVDWLTVAAVSVDAAQRLGDRHREADALNNLGLSLTNLHRFEEAVAAHREAAAIYRETGDRHLEGRALNNLGIALQEMLRLDEAIIAHQDAAAIHREAGDRYGEGSALNNLGLAMQKAGRFRDAITICQDAVAIHREAGDRHSEGGALSSLGLAFQQVERFDEAIAAHEEDIVICRETGDRHGEAVALQHLGLALQGAHRFGGAMAAHRDAAAIYRETDDLDSENDALRDLETAITKLAAGEPE